MRGYCSFSIKLHGGQIESEDAIMQTILTAYIIVVEDSGICRYTLAEHRRELAEKIEPDDKRINEQKNTDIQD